MFKIVMNCICIASVVLLYILVSHSPTEVGEMLRAFNQSFNH